MVLVSGLYEFNYVLVVFVCLYYFFVYVIGVFGFWVLGLLCIDVGNFCFYFVLCYCYIYDIYYVFWVNLMVFSVRVI